MRAVENGDDEAEDDPGQHGGRDGGRDAFDERADRTDEGRDEDQGARKKERSRSGFDGKSARRPDERRPGVDQAAMIGRRWRRLRKLVAAMLRQSAATQEEVWAE